MLINYFYVYNLDNGGALMKYINDRYKIIKKMPGGNMSDVYLCIDFENDNDVIIKSFSFNESDNNSLNNTLFFRELENLEKLNHEKIIALYDKGTDIKNSINFIVLEYFQSNSLDNIIYEKHLSNKQKYKLILDILNGIAYSHSKGVIHRDLKPSNILINDSFEIKIIDFGISKIKDSLYQEHTVKHYLTPRYASPEQKSLSTVDYKSDIYSLGFLITEILLGQVINEDIQKHINDLDTVDQDVKDILIKSTEVHLENRLDSVSELRNVFLSKIQSDRYIFGISFSDSVVNNLVRFGYLEKFNRSETLVILNNDLENTHIYIDNDNNSQKNEQLSYKIYGKQFEYRCVIDKYTKTTFTIIGIYFPNKGKHNNNKEWAINYNGEFEICLNISSDHSFEDINTLIEHFEHSKRLSKQKQDLEIKEKNSIQRWKKVLDLLENQLEEKKNTLQYSYFEVDQTKERIIVTLKHSHSDRPFNDDQLLCMTSISNINKTLRAGYCVDFIDDNKLIIQLSKDASAEDFAHSGEISIDKKMLEVSIARQKRALRAIEYRDLNNIRIADVLLEPKSAGISDLFINLDYASDLDKSKQEAVEKAIQSKEMFILQGPPGTGKTTFISELVNQIFKENPKSKVLIASQSNVAVDHALNKIKQILPKLNMLRIGRKDKLTLGSEKYMIEEQLEELIESIKENSLSYISYLRKQIDLDEEIIEKYEQILEIDHLKIELEEINLKILQLQVDLDNINKSFFELKILNEELERVAVNFNKKLHTINNEELSDITKNFKVNFKSLGEQFLNKLDLANNISSNKDFLETTLIESIYNSEEIQEKINTTYLNIGAETPDQFYELKNELSAVMKDNEKELKKLANIESLQEEWFTRIGTDDKIFDVLLKRTNIIGATCLGIASIPLNSELVFDWVIIDEAGRATAPELLVPMTAGKKIVLVGDHKQLPPILDKNIKELQIELKEANITLKDLEISLFEELMQNIEPKCIGQLTEQYRMHPAIGNLVSTVFYEGNLDSMTTAQQRDHKINKWSNKGVIWLTTSKLNNRREQIINNGTHPTFQNLLEVQIIFSTLLFIEQEYKKQGVFKEVGIIAGYQAQKSLIRKEYITKYKDKFKNLKIEINTVDAFQGRETDIVFYSVVRSNDSGKIGFLSDSRRLNVAMSRAKDLLVIVGDHESVTLENKTFNGENNPFSEVFKYIKHNLDLCEFEEVLKVEEVLS